MRREWVTFTVLALAAGVLVSACGDPPQADEVVSTWPTGVVLETMDGGGYTYAHVELDDTDMWVAGPVTPLKVGDTVSLVDTMFMGGFTSEVLDRSFDEIFFVMSFRDTEGALDQASGFATQVIATGGYTYVEVEGEGGTFWLAGPETDITEGTRVQWKGPMWMSDFHSPSLDRTFSEIMFVDSVWMSSEAEAGSSPSPHGE
jgi:hypothetical protein